MKKLVVFNCQFTPKLGGQFELESGGQFTLESGGQFDRFFHHTIEVTHPLLATENFNCKISNNCEPKRRKAMALEIRF